jgi:type II secretory pathway component PulK
MKRSTRDESGVALVIVLTIVALLTITVMEFTYNVQLDRHRTRNSLDAMQAKLLARSGINLVETFLAQDQVEEYDAFNEEWALALNEFCAGIELEPTMRLRCKWRDESGKININLARPSSTQQGSPDRITRDQIVRNAVEVIFAQLGVGIEEIGDQLREYFTTELPPDDPRDRIPDFGSVEEFAAFFKVPAAKLKKLRPYLTAQPANRVTKINANTAPELVLNAVLRGYEVLTGQADWEGGQQAVNNIIEQRANDPPFTKDGEVVAAFAAALDEKVRGAMSQMFGAKSSYFRLEASGLTNSDPTGETPGGIGQTLSVLVRRTRKANVRGQDDGRINWTFRRLDWQKEAGARLFHEHDSGLFDTDDEADEDETDEDDDEFSDRF